jgi:hypothetical protein
MAEPTLQNIFGENAVQDGSTVTISKQDLAAIGLSPASTNSAESLLVGIILKAASYLTDTNLSNNIDQSITIGKGFDSLITRNNQSYLTYQYNIEFSKLNSQTLINPNDF